LTSDNGNENPTKSGVDSPRSPPTSPVTFRLKDTLIAELDDIVTYEKVLNSGELIRSWIGERVAEYHKNKRFVGFQEELHPKPQPSVIQDKA
jgi:hypothetical protein